MAERAGIMMEGAGSELGRAGTRLERAGTGLGRAGINVNKNFNKHKQGPTCEPQRLGVAVESPFCMENIEQVHGGISQDLQWTKN